MATSGAAPPPAYIGDLSVKAVGTVLYQPPAYLFDELALVDDAGSLVAAGIDPIVAAIDQQDSRWTVAELSGGTELEQHRARNARLSRKTCREVLNSAVAQGKLPFLSLGAKGTSNVAECSSEVISAALDNVAAQIPKYVHSTENGNKGTSADATDVDLRRLMSTQYFMDVLAWQRLEQIQEALDPNCGAQTLFSSAALTGATSNVTGTRASGDDDEMKTAKRLKLEEDEEGGSGGQAASSDPWALDPASISHATAMPIQEKAPLYQALGSLVGQCWRQRSDFSAQTEINIPGVSSRTPYADLAKADKWTEIPKLESSCPESPIGVLSLLNPDDVRKVIQSNASATAAAAASEVVDVEASLSLSSFHDCEVLLTVPITQDVVRLGRSSSSSEEEDENGVPAINELSFPMFDVTAASSGSDAAKMVAPHHATLQFLPPTSPVLSDLGAAMTSKYACAVTNYGQNGCHLLTQQKWVLGQPAVLPAFGEVIALAGNSIFLRVELSGAVPPPTAVPASE